MCLSDETMHGEAMVLKVITKINNKLIFLHRINCFLTTSLRHLLCNVLIQPHFDYACFAWYPNTKEKLTHRIQTTQNKWTRLCLQLNQSKHISNEEFEHLNWLPVSYRFKQCVNLIVFRYFSKQCINYLNEVFDVTKESKYQLRGSFQKLKYPFRSFLFNC